MRSFLLARATFFFYLINFFWDFYWRHRKPVKLKSKVISVGNITVGGSGKTSIAGFIAEYLIRHGHKTAIVARGYKRPNMNPIVISSDHPFSWEDCGDEPAALARSIPGLSIYVDSNKTRAAQRASDDGIEYIIIDDGFQHRQLFRDRNLVCLDGTNPFGNGHLLPAGILREPKKSLKRADAIIIVDKSLEAKIGEWNLPVHIPIFEAGKMVVGIKSIDGKTSNLVGKKVIGFCGLGNPNSFHISLNSIGCEIGELLTFRDHYIYKKSNIEKITKMCKTKKCDGAVTTLKDAVKLEKIWPADIPLYYLEITIKLVNEAEFFKLLTL